MKCTHCGHRLKSTRENVKYDMSGLPGITLRHVEVLTCASCGERELVIPNLEGLHQAIAHTLVRKAARLTAEEIKFLRKWLGWSGADFARAMGTTPETVSRWESGATPMGVQADKLLRLMALLQRPIANYTQNDVAAAAAEDAKPVRAGFKVDGKTWREAA